MCECNECVHYRAWAVKRRTWARLLLADIMWISPINATKDARLIASIVCFFFAHFYWQLHFFFILLFLIYCLLISQEDKRVHWELYYILVYIDMRERMNEHTFDIKTRANGQHTNVCWYYHLFISPTSNIRANSSLGYSSGFSCNTRPGFPLYMLQTRLFI